MIGILGATGAVGRQVLRHLTSLDAGPLLLGCRNAGMAEQALPKVDRQDAGISVVDISDISSLQSFARECDIVINCAGPSFYLAERVARIVTATGAHVVDAGGSQAALAQVGEAALSAGRTIIWYAGAVPGISGILPRHLALGMQLCDEARIYHAIRDQYTHAGAMDFICDLKSQSTREVTVNLELESEHSPIDEFPYNVFGEDVIVKQYCDVEGDSLSRDLSLNRLAAYSVVEPGYLTRAIKQIQILNDEEAAASLSRASRLDLFGRVPRVILGAEMRGTSNGSTSVHSAIIESTGIAVLTGACAALSAWSLMTHQIPCGALCAAEILDPASTIAALGTLQGCILSVAPNTTLQEMMLQEEGVL